MTDWDIAYLHKGMPKPSNLADLYPDCFGHMDRLDDERIDRIAGWVMRCITTLIAIGMAVAGWTFYQQFTN